jgi:hypothetical protein
METNLAKNLRQQGLGLICSGGNGTATTKPIQGNRIAANREFLFEFFSAQPVDMEALLA